MDSTGQAFLDHWNWAAKKGVMNTNTAGAMRAAVSQVLGVLDNWQEIDVKTVDVEGTLLRFQNLRKAKFKPSVLETYKRRFRQAVTSYLSYLEDPGGWKPRTVERQAGSDKNASPERPVESGRLLKQETPQAGLVEYPFPLRDGLIARLTLPRDLRTAEVKRLGAFMSALVVDSEAATA